MKGCAKSLYSLAMLEYIKFMNQGNTKDLDAAAEYADNFIYKSLSHLKSLLLIGMILFKSGKIKQA